MRVQHEAGGDAPHCRWEPGRSGPHLSHGAPSVTAAGGNPRSPWGLFSTSARSMHVVSAHISLARTSHRAWPLAHAVWWAGWVDPIPPPPGDGGISRSLLCLSPQVQQSSFYGYTGMLPKRYTQGVMTGESEYLQPPRRNPQRGATHWAGDGDRRVPPPGRWGAGTPGGKGTAVMCAHLYKGADLCDMRSGGSRGTWSARAPVHCVSACVCVCVGVSLSRPRSPRPTC